MKRAYLFLVAAAAMVAGKPQTADDVIWYPVDDEDGVFISVYGEKHRSPENAPWRSHRRARYSGAERPPFLYGDPTENRDPSFFHNVRERRPFPAFQNHLFPGRPLGNQGRPSENSIQEIISEVFDVGKYPPVTESFRPTTGTAQWGRPRTPPERPGDQSDKLVFPDESPGTPTEVLPTEAPTMSPCERRCPVTPEFNPVCGSDTVTYSNAGRLRCAQKCGKDVVQVHHGSCGRPRFTTPVLGMTKAYPGKLGFRL